MVNTPARTADDTLIPLHSLERVQGVLRPIIIGGLAAGVLTLGLSWQVASTLTLSALVLELCVLALLLPLISRGRVVDAARLFSVTLLVTTTTMVWSYGSLRTIATLGFAFPVLISAVFLKRREMYMALLATWCCIGVLCWAEATQQMTVNLLPIGWRHAVMLDLGILFVGLVVGYARTLAVNAVASSREELEERKRAEERLRLSMEATKQGWFDLDLTSGVVEASAQFQRLMGAAAGRERHSMTRDMWIAAIHHEDRPSVLARFERCLHSGETEQMEYRLMGLDGSFRWIRSTAKVVQRDERGRPTRLTGTHADITDQRAVTSALEASERSYRALVEMSPVGVIVLRDGAVRYANPAALQMLGAPDLETLSGAGMQRFVPEEAAPFLADICHAAAKGEGIATAPIEQTMVRLDGARFEASIRCTAVVYEGSASLQFSFADISIQKQAEESRVRSRQLEALGTLAGGIAHDFNNILLAIRGNAELVAADATLSVTGVEQLQEILTAGQRASELVRRITAFARPKDHQHDLVSLSDVLHEVLRLLRPTVPAGISLEVHVDAEVPLIHADAVQVHETIVNLTTNAVYAIGSSRVGRITYRVDRVDLRGEQARTAGVLDGQYACLSVHDTGGGMDAETQRRIFDAFYTTKPVGQGSGLGLSMAYGTMRSHGGTISVESQPGHGATFRLLFPAASSTMARAPECTEMAAAPAIPLRVMFVDDEPQLVRLAERTLRRLGHRVTAFSDPVAALEQFRHAPGEFDVVVTDLSMPHMSGLDLARALRSTPSSVPIVMVTGYADEADEADARAAGVTRLAVKAADANQLSRLLAEVAPNA